MADPIDLEQQEADAARKAELERIERQIDVGDLKWLLGHKQGRRIARRLLEQYGVHRSVFRTDTHEMAFLEGQRNNGLRLMADILEHAPDRYVEMLQENKRARTDSSTSSTAD